MDPNPCISRILVRGEDVGGEGNGVEKDVDDDDDDDDAEDAIVAWTIVSSERVNGTFSKVSLPLGRGTTVENTLVEG